MERYAKGIHHKRSEVPALLGVKQSCLHRAFVLLGIQLGLSQTRLCRPSLWMAWKKTAGALCCLGGLDAFSTESHLRVHAANLRLLDVHTEQPHDGTFDPSVRRRRETHCNHRWQKKEENRRPRKIDKVRGTMARKRCVCVFLLTTHVRLAINSRCNWEMQQHTYEALRRVAHTGRSGGHAQRPERPWLHIMAACSKRYEFRYDAKSQPSGRPGQPTSLFTSCLHQLFALGVRFWSH